MALVEFPADPDPQPFITDVLTCSRMRLRKRLTRMDMGWMMVRRSQGANSCWVLVLKWGQYI